MADEFTFESEISKIDEDQQVLYGWLSVTVKDGTAVTDLQGDVIDTLDLQKAVWEFMDSDRVSATMHGRDVRGRPIQTGKIVDSIVVTEDLAKHFGLTQEGWFVGIKVFDSDTWEKVKAGEYRMLSIGGAGIREEIDE